MPRSRLRRTQQSFPFLRLPVDLQVYTLSCMDLDTLHMMISTVPETKALYMGYPASILRHSMSVTGLQIGNLMLAIFSIIQMIDMGVNVFPHLDLNITQTVLALLDSEDPQDIPFSGKDALEVIEVLVKLDDEISYLVEEYAHDIYNRASQRENPGVAPSPLVLSSDESYRITRAFYRLKLFGVLFYNYADRFKVDMQDSYGSFFDRLSTFEMDELTTAYQYLVRNDIHFTSAFPHNDCSYVPVKPYLDCRDPFNCETCRGRCLGPSNPSPPWWRGVQPFWHAVDWHYINNAGLWADPTLCRDIPVKVWNDVEGPNFPNAGWLVWCAHRDFNNINRLRYLYVMDFRVLGYCFWDRERLEGWDILKEFESPQWPVAFY